MSQLAKRVLAMLQASGAFRTVVESLPVQAEGSEPARQRLKQIEESLDAIKREQALILSEPLPATYPTATYPTDRNGWEYDVRAYTTKLDEKCRETLRIAMEGQIAMKGQLAPEGQKKIALPPNDPKHWSNIQLEMRDRCRGIDELGKRLRGLLAAINEAALVETDLVKLLGTMLRDGEGIIKAGHFGRIFQRHDAHHQQRFLINVFVSKGYLQPAQLPDGVHEETWTIVADTVKAALEKLTSSEAPGADATLETPRSPVKKKGLSLSRERAYRQYEFAVNNNAALDGATNREVYDWLKENLEEDDANKMPRASTFFHYLKEARRFYKTQKHTPRSGRATGKSVVDQDEI